MKFTLFTERGKIEKYVSETSVITFMVGRNQIYVNRKKHNGKREYINYLLEKGYTRKVKAGA